MFKYFVVAIMLVSFSACSDASSQSSKTDVSNVQVNAEAANPMDSMPCHTMPNGMKMGKCN